MSSNESVFPAVRPPSHPHQKEGKEEPDGEEPSSAVSEEVVVPEGWEPLPRDPNYKNSTYRTYRYRDVILSSMHLDWGCVQHWAQFRGRSTDIIVASFPKSGTTWLQEVVWRVVHGEAGPHSGAGVLLEYRFPLLDVAPVKDKMEMAPLHHLPDPRFIKTHLPYRLLPESMKTSGAKILYVSRDPRDVCVSLYHFSRLMMSHLYRGTFAEFRDSFARSEVFYGPYREHIRGYQEHDDTVLCVTYEQLHQDRAAVVRKVADFLDRPLTEEQVQDIVRYTSFEFMKTSPTTNFRHWENTEMIAKNEGTFMRKGVAGDWKNYFTQEESDDFMNELK